MVRLFIIVALLASTSVGCYKARGQNSLVDLTTIPERVAILALDELESADLGAHLNGSSDSLIITLKNFGHYAATDIRLDTAYPDIQAPFSFKGGAFPGTDGTCDQTVEPEATCTLVLTYAPVTHGTHVDTLYLTYVNGIMAFPLPIPLTARTAAQFEILGSLGSPEDLGVHPTNSTTELTLTLKNIGQFPSATMVINPDPVLALVPPFSYKDDAFPGTGGTCGIAVAPNGTCTIVIIYAPTENGIHPATLELSYLDLTQDFPLSIPIIARTPE